MTYKTHKPKFTELKEKQTISQHQFYTPISQQLMEILDKKKKKKPVETYIDNPNHTLTYNCRIYILLSA